MTYREEKRDLFSVHDDYALVHCISSDFALGAGIAIKFRQMGVVSLLEKYEKIRWECKGYCLYTRISSGRNIFNLVTKEHYFNKPTYQSIAESLYDLKYILSDMSINKLAMPFIGCVLDKLEWDKVSAIIKKVFIDTNIEILVCYL